MWFLRIFQVIFLVFCLCSSPIQFTKVTDSEITALGEELWRLDTNNVADLITIRIQGSATQDRKDNAPLPLLTVPPAVFQEPTIAKLLPLLDNYVSASNVSEVVTTENTNEETAFLDAVLETPIMQKLEDFLTMNQFLVYSRYAGSQHRIEMKKNTFRNELHQIWFSRFARTRQENSSSGFEHTFLGEINKRKVTGFHNWIYYALQEANDLLNYLGFIRILHLGDNRVAVKISFRWDGITKPKSDMFIGTSPEFEMALYTLCYYARPGRRCPITLNGKSVPITAYPATHFGKRYLSSAYARV